MALESDTTPATASAKDPEGPETPNLAKPEESPNADGVPETPGTPATASAKDSDNPKASGKPAEAPRADDDLPATASAKDPEGPEIPNLAKPDEAPNS